MLTKEERLREAKHWNSYLASKGSRHARDAWNEHPRVHALYSQKARIEGLNWRQWTVRHLGGPAKRALELGCGAGQEAVALWKAGAATAVVGLDIDESRFAGGKRLAVELGCPAEFQAVDVNETELKPQSFDLIYAVHSFHHFFELERIMERVRGALTPRGIFVLEEYVGPAKFQWKDAQLALTAQLLALMPRDLRLYRSGIEKRCQGRDTPGQVLAVCPTEALRSDEIRPLFHKYFQVLYDLNLGGTIQHLLYAGIIHNFPDDNPEIDHMIDCIDALETVFIDYKILTSDFALLVGRRPVAANRCGGNM